MAVQYLAAGAARQPVADSRQPSERHIDVLKGIWNFAISFSTLRDGGINSYAQFYSPTSQHDQRKPCGTKTITVFLKG